jgi:hypothetical protein
MLNNPFSKTQNLELSSQRTYIKPYYSTYEVYGNVLPIEVQKSMLPLGPVYVEKTILYLRSIVNTFSNGEIVYQYKRNPATENIVFVNTAIGTIISKNSSSITITNSFGTFANNVTLFGSSSTANAVVNKIMSLTNNYATVVTSNTTSVTLYQISGEFSDVQTLVGLTSNTYSNISSIAVNNESFATLNVINTLEAQIVNGFFVANSSVNSIVGVTSSDTANLSAIEYIQL